MIKKLIVLTIILLPLNVLAMTLAITPDEVIKKSQAAFFYPGGDFKARVMMKLISKGGQERVRELTMLRKNYGDIGGEQKYFIYFFEPADVRGMTFMVYKYPLKDDDRWLFIPSINLVQRVASRDKHTSFVGSDFSYEDVSGRDITLDRHNLLREELLEGRECYVVESIPVDEADYTKKVSFIDKDNFLPLKEEYYDAQGEVYRVFTASEVKATQEIPTVIKRTMENLKNGHRTEVQFLKVEYNIGTSDDLFSERHLRKPPAKWIQ